MNINEMEAGRELDALIGEQVKCWDEVVRQDIGPYLIWTSDDRVFPLPNYSTDITAAWQVDRPTWIWRFYEAKYGLEVTLDIPGRTMFANVLWTEVDGKVLAYALGRCRAALKAVSVKETNGETIPSE